MRDRQRLGLTRWFRAGTNQSDRRQAGQSRTFLVELIKPSHYDDDGYVIQWWRGFVPSNSLSSLYGLALDASKRRCLGDNVEIEIEAHDETNRKVPIRSIIRT